jgi:hypothetical protein
MADLTIEARSTVDEVYDDNVVVHGNIDDNCKVTIVSRRGPIVRMSGVGR